MNFTLLCRHNFFNMAEELNKFLKFRRKYQDVGGLKTPAFLNLLTWDALPPNKCSCQLKHFVEGQNLPRHLVDKFNWHYKKLPHCHDQCCIPPSRQGVGPREDTRVDVFYLWKMLSLFFIFPNDMPEILLTTRTLKNEYCCSKYFYSSTYVVTGLCHC